MRQILTKSKKFQNLSPLTCPRGVLLKLVHESYCYKLTGSFKGWILNIIPLNDWKLNFTPDLSSKFMFKFTKLIPRLISKQFGLRRRHNFWLFCHTFGSFECSHLAKKKLTGLVLTSQAPAPACPLGLLPGPIRSSLTQPDPAPAEPGLACQFWPVTDQPGCPLWLRSGPARPSSSQARPGKSICFRFAPLTATLCPRQGD